MSDILERVMQGIAVSIMADVGMTLTSAEANELADEIAAMRSQLAAAQAEVNRLRAVVEKMVAFSEIWGAEGTLSPTEAELFDAAQDALEG
jgi:hypothetical protein